MCQRGNCPFCNVKNLKSMQVDSLPKDTAEIETGIAGKSSPGTRQTDGNNLVWFGEIEIEIEMPTFTYRSSSEFFCGAERRNTSITLFWCSGSALVAS
jgi:hypothetical protein